MLSSSSDASNPLEVAVASFSNSNGLIDLEPGSITIFKGQEGPPIGTVAAQVPQLLRCGNGSGTRGDVKEASLPAAVLIGDL